MRVATSSTAPVVAAGLIGGYASARHAKRDDLATVVFAGAGVWCTRIWNRRYGAGTATGLLGCYLSTFAVSHPLARRIGAWPSVLAMSAVAVAVTAMADRPHPRA